MIAALTVYLVPAPSSTFIDDPVPPQPSPFKTLLAIAAVGVDPEALAAAGVQGTDVAAVISTLRTSGTLDSLDRAVQSQVSANAGALVTRDSAALNPAIYQGSATPIQSVMQSDAVSAVRSDVLRAFEQQIGTQRLAAAQACARTRVAGLLVEAGLALEATQDVQPIRQAFVKVTRARHLGRVPDRTSMALVDQLLSRPEVVEARTRVAANASAVSTTIVPRSP